MVGRLLATLVSLVLLASSPVLGQDGLSGPPLISSYGQRVLGQASQVETEAYQGITIEGAPAFRQRVKQALGDLQKTEAGKATVERLAQSGKKTTIADLRRNASLCTETPEDGYQSEMFDVDGAYAFPVEKVAEPTASGPRQLWFDLEGGSTPGSGANTLVLWNPDFSPNGFNPEVILGHELIHGVHVNEGKFKKGMIDVKQPDGSTDTIQEEEAATIGLNEYAKDGLTENTLRQQWNERFGTKLPQRTTWCDLDQDEDDTGDSGGQADQPQDPRTAVYEGASKKLNDLIGE